jgi:uncharacterized repeat protein (TIGR02543 family)
MQFIKSSPKHRKSGASLRYFLLAMLSAALFVVSVGSAIPTKAALIPNTDYLQLTLNTSTYTAIPETKNSGAQGAGGIAVSGNYKIEYAWTTSKTPANGDFVALTDAGQYGGTEATSKLRFIPTPTTNFGINTDVTLTLRKADPSAKLYGFHGWLPTKSTNDDRALSALPAAPDDRASITNLFTEFASFGTFSDLTDLRYAFANTSSSFEVKPELPSTVKNLTGLFGGSFYNKPEVAGWNVSNVTSMSSMFAGRSDTALGRSEFNQDISAWDVSKVTNMSSMFKWSKFNGNISSWTTTSLVNTQMMFYGAINFNGQLSSWDVSKVTNFSYMFAGPSAFNQPINSWNTSSATNFAAMFWNNTVFNQPLNQWSTSNVTNFSYMFGGATVFNQPLNQWSTSNVTNFSYMFSGATTFNQELQGWNMVRANNLTFMFSGASNFNNGEIYSASAEGTKPLTWVFTKDRLQNIMSLFNGASKFNQAVNNWQIGKIHLTAVFKNASVFNNGQLPSVGTGSLHWDLGDYTLRQVDELFSGAHKFNQNISTWNTRGFSYYWAAFNANSFNQSLGFLEFKDVTSGSNTMNFPGLSNANYEASAIEWSYREPPTTSAALQLYGNNVNRYSTCLGKAADTKIGQTIGRNNFLTTTDPAGPCSTHPVTWSAPNGFTTPYTIPVAVSGRSGFYEITPQTSASNDSNQIRYLVYSRANTSDCSVDPTTGKVTYSVLSVKCKILAYNTDPTSSALSSVAYEFTTFAPATYTVTYNYNSATSENTTVSSTWSTGDPAITLPTPAKANYTFDGWYIGASFTTATGATYTPSANITLYARFVAVVTFDPQNGSAVTTARWDVGSNQLITPSPTRAGYSTSGVNGGWYTDTSYGTRVVGVGSGYTPSGDVTLYAKWNANTLNVTYATNGGSSISSTTTTTGSTISQPSSPTRTGYTFNGWFSDSGLTSSISSWPHTHGATANFSIYAGWTANTLTITYSTNGGSSISSGSTVTGATISSAPTSPTRTGYAFVGWYSDSGLSAAVLWPYAHGKTADFTIYAKWTANTLILTYVSNGGSAVTNGSTVTAGTISSAPTAPTRSGYNFLGWYTDAVFTTAVNWPFTHGETTDFSLYAKWVSRTQSPLSWNLGSTSVPYQGSLSLGVTGGSGTGSVTYSRSGNSTCTISGSTLTPGQGGSVCVITATKAADADFDAASTVQQTITITKINQSSFSWNLSSTSVAYLGNLTLATTGGSGTGTVVYSASGASTCSIVGTTLIPSDAGSTCEITATKVSDTNYNSADSATQTITVTKISQATLSFSNSNALVYGQTMDLLATGGSGGGSITYAVSNAGTTGCSLSANRLSVTGAGTCAVTAIRASSTNYNASSTASLSITVSKASQTVSFSSTVPAEPIAGDTYTVTATSSSGLTPTITIASGPCTISSGVVTLTSAGNCVISADSSSTNQYLAATTATQTVAIGQRNQTLTFSATVRAMSVKTFGDPVFFAEASTSESTLTPVYSRGSATTNTACSVSSIGLVVILAVGNCEIEVNQAGNSAVAAASAIKKTFEVLPDRANAPFITSVSAGHESITAAFTAPNYVGGSAITGYQLAAVAGSTTITNSACTLAGSGNTETCTLNGLTNGTSYRIKVAAITAAGVGLYSELSAARVPATNPAAVSAFTAVPDNTSIVLTWQDPVSLGGGTFDSYRVFYKLSSSANYPSTYINIQSQSPTNYTITGLVNGESYDVRIVTVTTANTAALVSNTAEVKETPRTVPEAPATVEVLEVGGQLVVTWSTPQSDGGNAITEYRVTINGTTCTLANALDNLCTVALPVNGGTYPIEVIARNGAGFGSAATASFTKAGVSLSGGSGGGSGGGSESSSNGQSAIQVLALSVKSLPNVGGQVVSITGKNLGAVTTILVDGIKAKIISVTDGVIKFTAPRNTDGPATLTLKSPTASAEVVDAFTYAQGIAKVKVAWVLGFVQTNTTIKAADKAKLRSALMKNTGTVAVTCVGYQSYAYNTAKDAQTAMGRAKQACNYLKSVNPKLTVKSVIARTNLTGTPSRKLAVQFNTSK